MAKPETVDKVCKIVREQLSVEEGIQVTCATTFIDLNVDSLETVQVVKALEDEFDIEFPEEKVESINTFEKAAELVEELMANKA